MELAWQRQLQQERLLSQIQPANITGAVREVKDLAHLERVLEVSGGALCVLMFYSRVSAACAKSGAGRVCSVGRRARCRGQRERLGRAATTPAPLQARARSVDGPCTVQPGRRFCGGHV